jgi:hypothetical protein
MAMTTDQWTDEMMRASRLVTKAISVWMGAQNSETTDREHLTIMATVLLADAARLAYLAGIPASPFRKMAASMYRSAPEDMKRDVAAEEASRERLPGLP